VSRAAPAQPPGSGLLRRNRKAGDFCDSDWRQPEAWYIVY